MPIYNNNFINFFYVKVFINLSESYLELGFLAVAIGEVIHAFFWLLEWSMSNK